MDLDRYLSPAEHVVFGTRRHFVVLAEDISIVVGALFVYMVLPYKFVGIGVAIIVVRFSWKALDWFTDRLLLTNQRILGVSGLMTRKVASMPLGMLTDLTYQRTLFGRLFGYGTIRAESAGQEQGLSRLHYVANDIQFYRTLTALLHPPKEEPVVDIHEQYANEAMALVRRGQPVTTWDPDDTNPNMIVLP